MSSSPEIVRCLINAGARLVARLVDGQTALHIAATRGSAEIVKALMNKSLANEEEEYEKDGRRRAARRKERQAESAQKTVSPAIEGEDMSGSEASVGEGNMEKECSDSMTMGSFVEIDKPNPGDEDVSIIEISPIAVFFFTAMWLIFFRMSC
jgi:ankyrin repeat protein